MAMNPVRMAPAAAHRPLRRELRQEREQVSPMAPLSRSLLIGLLVACAGAGGAALGQTSPVPAAVARAYQVEPFIPQQTVRIQGEGVRLRAEPFATRDTPVLSSGDTGLELTVVGLARMPDWAWYQVILRNGQKAFIRSDLTSAPLSGARADAGAIARAPAAAAPAQRSPQPAAAGGPGPGAGPLALRAPAVPRASDVSPPAPPASPTASPNAVGSMSSAPPPAAAAGLIPVAPAAPVPRMSSAQPLSETIMTQLLARRCWTDSSAMLDAHRLRATFALSFRTDGKLGAEPVLIDPPLAPADDPPMMVFIAKARAALRTCNAMGFDIPADYFGAGPQPEVWIEFRGR